MPTIVCHSGHPVRVASWPRLILSVTPDINGKHRLIVSVTPGNSMVGVATPTMVGCPVTQRRLMSAPTNGKGRLMATLTVAGQPWCSMVRVASWPRPLWSVTPEVNNKGPLMASPTMVCHSGRQGCLARSLWTSNNSMVRVATPTINLINQWKASPHSYGQW